MTNALKCKKELQENKEIEMAKQITNIQKVSDKANTHEVQPSLMKGSYIVTSATSGNVYRTRLLPVASCTCNWAKYQKAGQPVACSHVQATLKFIESEKGYRVKMFASEHDTSRQKRRTVHLGNGVKAIVRKTAVITEQQKLDDLNDLLFG